MGEDRRGFIVRDMLAKDLQGVVAVHHNCFPSTISLFTALPEFLLEKYYGMFLSEGGNSSAAVVEMADSGIIVGYTFGTREPGIRGRFINRYPIHLAVTAISTTMSSSEFRRALLHKKGNENTLYLKGYNEILRTAGVPDPKGREDIWMGLAIHSAYRGGGKAASLVAHYCRRVFEMSDATRVRGAILKANTASMTLFKRLGWEFCDVTENQVSIWKNKGE